MKKASLSIYSVLLLFAVLTISLASCGDDIAKPKEQLGLNETVEQDLKKNETFPFEKIKANSQIRKRFVDMGMLPKKLNPISKSFFKKWLGDIYVDKSEKKLKYQLPDDGIYHFYDFAETNEWFLFSIIHSNADSPWKELIHFTCDKTTEKINRAEWVATDGDEGYYSNHSKLEYSPDRLTITVTSEISQLVDRHWETSTKVTQSKIKN